MLCNFPMFSICYINLKKSIHIYFGSERGFGTSIDTHPVNFETEPSALTNFRTHASIHVTHSIEW